MFSLVFSFFALYLCLFWVFAVVPTVGCVNFFVLIFYFSHFILGHDWVYLVFRFYSSRFIFLRHSLPFFFSLIPFLFFSWWRLRKFSAFSSRWRLGKFRAFFSMVAEKILCFSFSVLSQDTVDRKTLQRFAGKTTLFSIAVPQLNFILAPCSVLSYLPSSPLITPLK